MAERVTDLRDIRDRVVAQLSGLPEPGVPVPEVPSILCAEDLAPADTAGLDPALILGLATTLGGPTSHTAIIARQLAIPCVVAIERSGRRRAGHHGADRRHPRDRHRVAGRRRGRRRRSPARKDGRCAVGSWTGPGATADGQQRVDPGQCAGRRRGALGRATPPPRASACSAPSCASSTRETEPTVDEQAADLRRSAAGLLGPQGGGPDARCRLGQAAEVRRTSRRGQPGARRARHPNRHQQPGYAGPAAGRRSPRRPSRPATRRG